MDPFTSFFLPFHGPKLYEGFPGGPVVKNPPANAGDAGSIPGWGRSSGEGTSNPLHSCLGNRKRVRHDLATKQ